MTVGLAAEAPLPAMNQHHPEDSSRTQSRCSIDLFHNRLLQDRCVMSNVFSAENTEVAEKFLKMKLLKAFSVSLSLFYFQRLYLWPQRSTKFAKGILFFCVSCASLRL